MSYSNASGSGHGAGSAAPPPPPPNPPHHSSSTSSTDTATSQGPGAQHASPVDWQRYMNFSTPSINDLGGRQASGSALGAAGPSQPMAPQSHAPGQASDSEQYRNFARGVAHGQSQQGAMSFQHPHAQAAGVAQDPQQQQQQQHQQQSQHQPQQQQVPTQQYAQQSLHAAAPPRQAAPSRSPVVYGSQLAAKGKSPVAPVRTSGAQSIAAGGGGGGGVADNGLSLDPSAFSRDIRFQVPSFLAQHAGGAPAFPPGGEAWTGFSPAGFFGAAFQGAGPGVDAGSSLFTPSGSFGYSQPYEHGFGGNEPSGGGHDVLEGLGDFLGDTGTGLTPNFNPAFFSHASPGVMPPADAAGAGDAAHSMMFGMAEGVRTGSGSGSSAYSQQPAAPQQAAASSHQASAGMATAGGGPGAMATASILPSQPRNYLPINIASSSTQPYAPPPNVDELLSQPPPFVGPPSLKDGPGLYSTTGFDMVGVLARVANRKDPKTTLGPVDLSCSFVVVDVRKYDAPIVYASPTFTALTGYDLPALLNRNCRFLQSPDGDVVKGSKRKYTDNVAVAHLKRMLNAGKECQASLINYRRGGVPFINLVTVVPIPWDGTDIVYHVGFQVDLVEQPNAILRNMRDGSYQVNYTVANPPQPPLRAPARPNVGASGLSQEVLDIMGARVHAPSFSQGEDGGKMEWLKMVLENADDFIHVLSLKGSFQYVSPSVRRVLEYEPEDLLNKNVSDFCHPSDIVPLMRELKDSTHAPNEGQPARTVNLVFRIRRKTSGYVWIESVGRLHVEPGKGRKAVILSGRARTVPVLPWDAVATHGGLAEAEFWSRISFQGLILHATPGTHDVLGQPADDLVGTSFYSLLPGGDNGAPQAVQLASDATSPVSRVGRAILQATATAGHGGVAAGHGAAAAAPGDCVSVMHDMMTRAGHTVAVTSVFYAAHASASATMLAGSREREDSSDDGSDTSRPTSTSSSSIAGAKPCYLVVQTKRNPVQPSAAAAAASAGGGGSVGSGGMAVDTPAVAQVPPESRPIVHPLSANLFEELETTRGTSWQYELHQLRLLNRRLRDDIATARKTGAGGAAGGGASGKKRPRVKLGDGSVASFGSAGPAGGGGSSGGLPPMPEHLQAAPRHQLAPGFGLVAPGMSSPYYS